MPDAPPEPQAGESPKRPAARRTARRSLSRGAVHLGLLCSAAAALATLDLLHVRIAIHTDVGLAFVGLVAVHLAQRRRTLARMATRIVRARTIAERGIRLGRSTAWTSPCGTAAMLVPDMSGSPARSNRRLVVRMVERWPCTWPSAAGPSPAWPPGSSGPGRSPNGGSASGDRRPGLRPAAPQGEVQAVD